LRPARASTMFFAAGLMVAAGLIKHNIIAVPLATTAWIALRGRQSLLTWLGAVTLAMAAGLGMLLAIWGFPALHSVLMPRNFSMSWMATYSRKLLALADIPLASWALLTLRGQLTSDMWLAAFLVIASLLEILLFAGGEGVVYNIAYDLLISLALALGLATGGLTRPYEAASLIGLLLFYFSLAMPLGPLDAVMSHEAARSAEETVVKQDLAYMKQHPGAALCLDMALCWYAGVPVVFDPFNMGEQFALHLRPVDQLVSLFRAKEFAIVQIAAHPETTPNPLPPAALSALLANYVADRQSEGRIFLLPRP
jgi:hypothetical protein